MIWALGATCPSKHVPVHVIIDLVSVT